MSAEEKFILVDKDFVEKGLTLEEAYILGRVKSLSDENLIYRETNESIANAMGKSVRAVKNWINSLVKKGYLKREYRTKNTRYLTVNIDSVKNAYAENEPHAELEKASSINGLSLEEKVQRMQEAIQNSKDPNYDSTEEL